MPRFSQSSLHKLETCHPVLQALMHEVIRYFDVKIIEGFRSLERQKELFDKGMSKISSGGRHNYNPSLAIDCLPWPFSSEDWSRPEVFAGMARYCQATFHQMQRDGRIENNYKLIWGGDWDDDPSTAHRFFDGPHLELHILPIES